MLQSDIDTRFDFHAAPDKEKRDRHTSMRLACKKAAESINDQAPDSREKSIAITKLEEAMFWANAAVARVTDTKEK